MRVASLTVIALCTIAGVNGILLGLIRNFSLIAMPSDITISRSTCEDCQCAMLTSMNNLTILSFNCLTLNPTGVVCQLFTSVTYLTPQSYQMVPNTSSTYYFRQLPPANQMPTIESDEGNGEFLPAKRKVMCFVCRIISIRWSRISYFSSDHGDGKADCCRNTGRRSNRRLVQYNSRGPYRREKWQVHVQQ